MVGSTGKHVQPFAVSTKTVVCFGYHERPHGATSRRRHDINDSMMVIIWATTTVGELLEYSLFRCLVNSKLQWTIFTTILRLHMNLLIQVNKCDIVWQSKILLKFQGVALRCYVKLLVRLIQVSVSWILQFCWSNRHDSHQKTSSKKAMLATFTELVYFDPWFDLIFVDPSRTSLKVSEAWQIPGLELGLRVSNCAFASREVRWEDKDRSEKGGAMWSRGGYPIITN